MVALMGLAVVAAGFVRYGYDLEGEPDFADEWAYYAQAFYGPLWWSGRWNDRAWLEYGGLDLPPLPKYAAAAMLTTNGIPLPPRGAASAWYWGDINNKFGTKRDLTSTRWPSVAMGALGLGALFVIGAMVGGRWVGLLAAGLLAANPLYAMLARRAMSDVPTEAFTLIAEAVAMRAWIGLMKGKRPWGWALLMTAAGVPVGLAISSKLSGGMGALVIGGWLAMGFGMKGVSAGRKALLVGSSVAAGAIAFGVMLGTNPTLTANPPLPRDASVELHELVSQGPVDRAKALVKFRSEVSKSQQSMPKFQEYALETIAEKVPVVVVQGFGRFGPLGPRRSDSTKRFDWGQDWGGLLWGPLVMVGLVGVGRGAFREEGNREMAGRAMMAMAMVTMTVVVIMIPLAWDRYLLSMQPVAAVFGAVAVAWGARWGMLRWRTR